MCLPLRLVHEGTVDCVIVFYQTVPTILLGYANCTFSFSFDSRHIQFLSVREVLEHKQGTRYLQKILQRMGRYPAWHGWYLACQVTGGKIVRLNHCMVEHQSRHDFSRGRKVSNVRTIVDTFAAYQLHLSFYFVMQESSQWLMSASCRKSDTVFCCCGFS